MFQIAISLGVLAAGAYIVDQILSSMDAKALAAGQPFPTFGIWPARTALTVGGILASVFLAPIWWPLGTLGLVAALGAQWAPVRQSWDAWRQQQLSQQSKDGQIPGPTAVRQ